MINMTTNKQKLICPACNAEIDHLIEWHDTSVGYPMTFNGEYDYKDKRLSDTSEFDGYACPECGETLFTEVNKEGVVIKLTR